MQKKLIVLALASAFAVPAFAATSNVDISGKMAFSVGSLSGTGTSDDGMVVNDENSRISVKGSEDLGNGLKAGFAATYQFNANQSGTNFAGQEIYGSLGGGFGTVIYGVHDNLVKGIGRKVDLFGDQTAGDARYMTKQGFIDGRGGNVVAYVSPSFSGLQAAVAYNPDEKKGSNNGAAGMASLSYTNGPLYAALGYYKVDNNGSKAASAGGLTSTTVAACIGPVCTAPTTTIVVYTTFAAAAAVAGSDEKGWRAGLGYTMGDLKLVGLYQKVDNAGGIASKDSKTWGAGAAYKMGAITLKGQYYSNNASAASSDSKMYVVGADYSLSKRTTVQLAYNKVKNDTAASLGGGAVTGGADSYTIAKGKDPSRLTLGVRHDF
jgi:predicted porin